MPEWLIPWIVVGLVIWPLLQVERWMHRHIQGLSLLITNNAQAAVLIYYLLLLPGVILHEGSQWLMAQALRVKIKQFKLWPEQMKGGKIRLGLVEIVETDIVRATLVGMIPLAAGVAIIVLIGGARFDTDVLLQSLGTGNVPTMLAGIGQFTSAPDFWLWVYLVFAIANAMMPEEHDRISWWLFAAVVGGLLIFLWILDLGILIQAGLEGPFAALGRWLSLALVISLVLDLLVMGLISLLEAFFSRVLRREPDYDQP
jgi:hypothetical protein